jgi:hypothetical protein
VGHEITLGEEEISDVSLATFYVFDKENPGTSRPDVQLARGGRGGCHGYWRWLNGFWTWCSFWLSRHGGLETAFGPIVRDPWRP